MTFKFLKFTTLVCFMFGWFFVRPVLAEYQLPGSVSQELALKIGEKLYRSQKQGCVSCHRLDGTGGQQAGAANLQTPSKWKSALIAKQAKELGVKNVTPRTIAVGLILNGAEKWNAEFYNKEQFGQLKNKIFFDRRMIGVHSTALRANLKMAKRMLKRKRKRVASKNILRLMAESVYIYMNKEFFLNSK
ncbi:MAG: hypothetical protein VX617_01985 [Pseudomonadota bacterium]|nr:hypothetical protein [Pseudomonadota bacterium]